MNDMSQKTDKPVILAIFGKSAAGKDTLKGILSQSSKFHIMRQWTTRPMRDSEQQDREYHFCTVGDFTNQLLSPESMIEAGAYNNWYYGTPASEVLSNVINVGIFGPKVIDCLIEEQCRYDIFFLEVITDDKERLIRSLHRELNPDCHEICRRFLEDEKDFNIFYMKRDDEEISKGRLIYIDGDGLKEATIEMVEQDLLKCISIGLKKLN